MNTGPNKKSFLQTWMPLTAVCLAMFIVVVDSTMMNVAVSAIVTELNTTVSAVQAGISVYSLVMASLMLTGGKLGDIYGIKKMFIAGIVIYGVGTTLAAISPTIGVLFLGWSLIEGIAAALIIPLAMTLIITNYEGPQRAFGFGVLGGFQATAAAVGPILGGFLTTNFSWRWGFGLQVIVVVIVLLLVRYIRESEPVKNITLDWGGTILSVIGLALIVFGFILAGRYGWWEAKRIFTIGDFQVAPLGLSIVPFLLAFGLVFLVVFVHWQLQQQAKGHTPLVRLELFSNRQFVAGFMTDTVQSLILAGLLFVTPLFLQTVLSFSALQSGIALLPLSVAVFIVSLTTPGLSQKIAPKSLVQLGIILMGIGTWLYYNVVSLSMTTGQMIFPFLVFGAGTGLMLAQITNLTLSAVKPEESGEGSGVNNTVKELGSSLGTAVIGSILLASVFGGIVDGVLREAMLEVDDREREAIAVELEDALETFTPEEQQAAIAQLPENVQQALGSIVDTAVIEAKQETLLGILFFVIICLLVSTFLPREMTST